MTEVKQDPRIEQYKERLKRHDWTYDFSDDQRVWKAGNAERKSLEMMRNAFDKDAAIWNSIAPTSFHLEVEKPEYTFQQVSQG